MPRCHSIVTNLDPMNRGLKLIRFYPTLMAGHVTNLDPMNRGLKLGLDDGLHRGVESYKPRPDE